VSPSLHSLAGPSDSGDSSDSDSSGDSSDSGSSGDPSDSGAGVTDIISCRLRLSDK